MFLESERGRWIVYQHIGVEYEQPTAWLTVRGCFDDGIRHWSRI